MEEHKNSDAQAIIDVVERLYAPETFNIIGNECSPAPGITVLFKPKGMDIVDIQSQLDQRATTPRRAKGNVNADTLDSFIALVERHASENTVIYVDGLTKLVAVLNDNGKGNLPQWRDHRVLYKITASKEWDEWTGNSDKQLSVLDFAKLLENRCLDIMSPKSVGSKTAEIIERLGVRVGEPVAIQGLAKGLSLNVKREVQEVRHLDSGETELVFKEQHNRRDNVVTPNAFVIAIPVVVGGPAYTLVVRLRYKLDDAHITWSFKVVHSDMAVQDAIQDMIETLRTRLPGVLVVEGTTP